MTQRSQSRLHTGKRGAAQRKARREGYACARHYAEEWMYPSDQAAHLACKDGNAPDSERSHLAAAFRHGAHDWSRKYGGGA